MESKISKLKQIIQEELKAVLSEPGMRSPNYRPPGLLNGDA